MESNFKLLVHNNSESLHMKLMGDFGVAAAGILMKSLQKYHQHFKKIFIHTSCLDTIETAGTKAFQHGYNLPDDDINEIVFTGEHASPIAPYVWRVL